MHTVPQTSSCQQRVPEIADASFCRGSWVPQQATDSPAPGYMVCVECGHNGVMSGCDLYNLSLFLRAARFGRLGVWERNENARERPRQTVASKVFRRLPMHRIATVRGYLNKQSMERSQATLCAWSAATMA